MPVDFSPHDRIFHSYVWSLQSCVYCIVYSIAVNRMPQVFRPASVAFCSMPVSLSSVSVAFSLITEAFSYLPAHVCHVHHCPKSNPNIRDITWSVEENEIFRAVFCVPRYISWSRKITYYVPVGQCCRFQPCACTCLSCAWTFQSNNNRIQIGFTVTTKSACACMYTVQ